MIKDKVGAEPKEKRVKHYYDKDEAFHIGVSRDEWCCYRSKRYPFVAIGGYFLNFGDKWAKNHSLELLEKYWDGNAFNTKGYKDYTFAVVDRKRKIAVIKSNCRYSWNVKTALPDDFTVYDVLNIPVFNITSPRNRKTLLKEYAKYLIDRYMMGFYQEFKVLNSNSKCLYEDTSHNYSNKLIDELKKLATKVPTKISLFDKDYDFVYFGNNKVKYPTIDDILNDNLFSKEQKEYFAKCIFYTKYIYGKNTIYSWKDVNDNWDKVVESEVVWQDYVANKEEKKKKQLIERFKECRAKVAKDLQVKIKEFVNNLGYKNVLDCWRKGNLKYNVIDYKDCRIHKGCIEWYDAHHVIDKYFNNVQLRLKDDNVITSKGARVPIIQAINLFNKLYLKYFIDKNTDGVVFSANIKVGYYRLRFIKYKEKVTDNGKPLGYKEWLIQIGCHSLWFDDVKDFARYYNLQDKLNFPLDKTTQECRDNKLIHIIQNPNDRK